MKRREFMKGAAVAGAGAAVAASTLPKPAIAQGKKELKMVTTWPKNFPGLGTGAERLARNITAMSGGSLTVKVFAAGELVPPFESFDAVSSGTADMYHAADYYWQGKSKAFNFYAAVPFGLTATEQAAWIHHGGGQQLWDELSKGFGIKPFMAGNTGVQMGGWFNKEVNSLEDYKGLKIRMPGLGGEVLRRIGAAAVSLPGGEIFPALQSGAIDATEWVGPWNDLAFGFYKVTKFYYYPGFHEPGTTLSSGVNLKTWEGLSADHKAIITTAMAAENDLSLSEFNARNNGGAEYADRQAQGHRQEVPGPGIERNRQGIGRGRRGCPRRGRHHGEGTRQFPRFPQTVHRLVQALGSGLLECAAAAVQVRGLTAWT